MNPTRTTKRITSLLLSSAAVFALPGPTAVMAEEAQTHNIYSFDEEAATSYSKLLIKTDYGKSTDQLMPESAFGMETEVLITGDTYKKQIETLLNTLIKNIKNEHSKGTATVNGLDQIEGSIEYVITTSHPLAETPNFTCKSNIPGVATNLNVSSGADKNTFTVSVDIDWGALIKTKFKDGGLLNMFSIYSYPDWSLKLQADNLSFAEPLPKINKDTVSFTGKVKTCSMSAEANSIKINYLEPDDPDKASPNYIQADKPISNNTKFTANFLNGSSTSPRVKIVEKITNQNKPSTPQQPTTPIVPSGPQTVMRLYNPNTGEHLFTTSEAERMNLASLGWNVENNDWATPDFSDMPIYRVYNPNNGDHHYTPSADEVKALVSYGWLNEGTKLYSATEDDGIAIYRLYNPNADGAGSHHYTSSSSECSALQELGWNFEGVAWYGLRK